MDKLNSETSDAARNATLQTVYANLSNINNRIRSDFDAIMSHLSLSTSQIHLLMRLHDLPAPVIAKQLADSMHLTPGAISQIIEFLSGQDYVQRSESISDRRVAYLSLTPKGRQLVEECNRAHDKLIMQAMATLSHRELEQLVHIQHKILRHMETHAHESNTSPPHGDNRTQP